ncbi:MAG TPA: ankyrin repeat domain-containing protein [Methylomirabilota bacterium]|nr:ankyrin repeat domain-containing protein [Methylomirabilota bacterium]
MKLVLHLVAATAAMACGALVGAGFWLDRFFSLAWNPNFGIDRYGTYYGSDSLVFVVASQGLGAGAIGGFILYVLVARAHRKAALACGGVLLLAAGYHVMSVKVPFWQKQMFYNALESNDRGVIEASLHTMPKWMYGGNDWDTPLIWLIRGGYPDVAIQLLGRGGNPNEFDHNRRISVLHVAARGPASSVNASLIRRLVEEGARVNEIHGESGTALHAAIRAENLAATKILFEHGANPLLSVAGPRRKHSFVHGPRWNDAFHVAAGTGNETLLSTVWRQAAECGSIDAIEENARKEMMNALEQEVKLAAIWNALDHRPDEEIRELLDQKGPAIDAKRLGILYIDAIHHGKWRVTSWLGEHEVKPAGIDIRGNTPLMLALKRGKVDLARDLVVLSDSYDRINADGETALTLAIEGLEPELAVLIIDRGADIDAGAETSRYGGGSRQHALKAAAMVGDAATACRLLNRGYDAQKYSDVLDVALERGHFEVARVLLDAGVRGTCTSIERAATGSSPTRGQQEGRADPRSRDHRGRVAILSALIERGADPDCLHSVSPTGELTTLMKLALFHGDDVEGVRALVEAGADPDIVSTENHTGRPQTALSFASMAGHGEIADYLRSVGAAMP